MLTLDQLLNAQTAAEWEATILAQMTALGLPTTSWQPGDPERTIIAGMSQTDAAQDQVISTQAAGAYLQYAAAVTPDPSIDPTAQGGWLDLLAANIYGVTRSPAKPAATTLSITNTSASTYGPFAAGTYHVDNPATGVGYTNAASLTIAPGSSTAAIVADLIGAAGTSGVGTITHTTTSLTGVSVTNPAAAVGVNAQSNASLVTACQNVLTTISPNGPGQAYTYFATQSNLTGYPSLAGGPITRTLQLADPTSGQVTLYVANSAGAPVAGDIALMQSYLYAHCVPSSVTLTTTAPSSVTATIVVNLWLPTAYFSAVTTNLNVILPTYFAALAIGGETLPGGSTKGVPISQIISLALVAGVFGGPTVVSSATATINGAAADLAMGTAQVASLGSVTINVFAG